MSENPFKILPFENNPISILLYGESGKGKTTLGCSLPNTVVLDFENGLHRVNYNDRKKCPSMTPKSYKDVTDALEYIAAAEKIKSVVVDSVDTLIYFIENTIAEEHPDMAQRDPQTGALIGLTLKGYGLRKNIYRQFCDKLRNSNKNICFISHEVTSNDRRGLEEIVVHKPNINPETFCTYVEQDMDLIGWVFGVDSDFYVAFDKYGEIHCKNHPFGIWRVYDEKNNTFKPIKIPNTEKHGNTFFQNWLRERDRIALEQSNKNTETDAK